MDRSMQGFTVLHYIPEFAQIHIHWVSDTERGKEKAEPAGVLPRLIQGIRSGDGVGDLFI